MSRYRKSSAKATVGLAPGTTIYVGNKPSSELFIEVYDYSPDVCNFEELNQIEDTYSYIDSEPITWLNINGLNHTSEIEKIGKYCKLHPLIIEDIANTQQRPKVDEYEDYLFVVMKMLYFDDDKQLIVEHISLVLGDGYVVSFQESTGDVFDELRNRIKESLGRIRSMGADYLLYALMDAVIDNYFHLIEAMGDKLEELEDELFKKHQNTRLNIDIQNLKREILRIRRAVVPLRDVINRIENISHTLIAVSSRNYLRDLHDHVIQITESTEIYREMIWSLMDMYMTNISNKMNEVMKVLTIIATIFIPLTFLTGIYGMNFKHIPELDFRYGYFVLWGIMIMIFVGLLFYFRKKRWI